MKKNLHQIVLLTLCILRLWVMPLWSSFWTDEIGTAFVVKYGAYHPSFDIAPQFRTSIYYLLPRAADAIFGFSEAAYRLPSLILMVGALLLLWKLAAQLIDTDAAWVAVFAAFALAGFHIQ